MRYIINFIRAQDWDGLVTLKGCKNQEWSKQYTPVNLFQEGQQEDKDMLGG